VGAAPERVTSSASTPVLGPVHSGAVPPRTGGPPAGSRSCPASTSRVLQSPHSPSSPCTRTCTTVSVTAGSAAQVTPTSENGAVPVRRTVSVGAVAGTPLTGSVGPRSTSAAGAGSCTDPIATSSVDVSTGTGSGAGAA
jgi:hypothetical protein